MITEAKTAQKILNHLGLQSRPPPNPPPERSHQSPIQPIGAVKQGSILSHRAGRAKLAPLPPPTFPASPTSPLPSACPSTHYRQKHLLFSLRIGDGLVQNVLCRHRPGSGAEDDIPDHGTKTAFELPIRFAMVSLKSQAEDSLRQFEEAMRDLAEVRECHMLNGEIDFILKIVSKDLQSFQEFLTSKLTLAPNVASVKTSLTIRTANRCLGCRWSRELWGEGR